MVSTFTNLDYQVGKYFKVREFQSKDGYPTVLIDDNLVDLLDQIREYFGKPVLITSGYRTKSHNAAVGGVSNSQHTLGKAADIQVSGVPPAAVQTYVYDHSKYTVGTYTTFTHVDTRTTVKLFRGNTEFVRANYEKYKAEEIPDYAKEIIEDLIKSDIIKGTGEGLNLTEDMLRTIVICYRMALTNANNIYQLAKTLGGETK